MDYGDGQSEVRAIPQGTGTEAVTFSHVFGGSPNTDSMSSDDVQAMVIRAYAAIAGGRDPRDAIDVARLGAGAFSQRATLVETGAYSYALTLHR